MAEAHDEHPALTRYTALRKMVELPNCFRSASRSQPSRVLPAATFCLTEIVAHAPVTFRGQEFGFIQERSQEKNAMPGAANLQLLQVISSMVELSGIEPL